MRKNQKEKKALAIVLSVMILVFVAGVCGIYLYSQTGESQDQPQVAVKKEADSETDAMPDAGVYYYKDIDEKNVAWAQEDGLQYADNQLVLTMTDGASEKEVKKLIDPYQGDIVGKIEKLNIYQVEFPKSYSRDELDDMIEEFGNSDSVESCTVNHVLECDLEAFYPNDEKWRDEWETTPSGSNWGMEAIHAPEAWDYRDEMHQVNVGVYDNQFYNHDDLKFYGILENADQLNNTHRTHVSGTIGALFNNDTGVCGVFPKARLYGASFEKAEGTYGSTMGMQVGVFYLVVANHCKVLNMSIGYYELTYGAARGNEMAQLAINTLAQEMGDYFASLLPYNDFVICKAAGNDNSTESFVRADADDSDATFGYILYRDEQKSRYQKYKQNEDFQDRISNANKDGCVESNDFITAITNPEVRSRILVVGAAENLGNGQYKVADFSNCGDRVDVVAPGVDIYSTKKKKDYGTLDGTSMATPHVTGVAAMCFAINKNLTGAQVVDIIKNTAEGTLEYTNNNGSRAYHYGMLNAQAAVERARSMASSQETNHTEETNRRQNSNVTRDVVMVLDNSGSMAGDPLDQTKQASQKFINTVFEQDSRVALVGYENSASVLSELSENEADLTDSVDAMEAGGGTNMYAGLESADQILSGSTADRKIIVLMSDGLPNDGPNENGSYEDALITYAEELKNKGYYVYTLGFFENVYGGELTGAQNLMESMASPGLHYEVKSADDLIFFFEDIANQIGGRQYVYIRIACPVDVTVTSGGETLSSKVDSENTRTSFGALTYENTEQLSEDSDNEIDFSQFYYDDESDETAREDQVKVLRLDREKDYDIKIDGYADGTMDYTVKYQNAQGEYTDTREFPSIPVNASMQATSSTGSSDTTYLEVDEDGDGKTDKTYKAKSNQAMEEVKDRTILYILIAVIAVLVLLVIILIVVLVVRSKNKKAERWENVGYDTLPAGYICGVFGRFEGQVYPMDLGQECVVGRKADCDIQIIHGEISRIHCVIRMLPDGVFEVTDYSSNGTFYNNQKLKRKEPYRLPSGAILALGDADNVLELRREEKYRVDNR